MNDCLAKMKRFFLLLLVSLLLLIGCPDPAEDPEEETCTFKDISQPYLDEYGKPDDIDEWSEDSIYWEWNLEDKMLTVWFCNYAISDEIDWEVADEEFWQTFDQVSQYYLKQYDSPEEITEYASSDYHSIKWWWWSKGFEVTFLRSAHDDVRGWIIDSTYSFDPI